MKTIVFVVTFFCFPILTFAQSKESALMEAIYSRARYGLLLDGASEYGSDKVQVDDRWISVEKVKSILETYNSDIRSYRVNYSRVYGTKESLSPIYEELKAFDSEIIKLIEIQDMIFESKVNLEFAHHLDDLEIQNQENMINDIEDKTKYRIEVYRKAIDQLSEESQENSDSLSNLDEIKFKYNMIILEGTDYGIELDFYNLQEALELFFFEFNTNDESTSDLLGNISSERIDFYYRVAFKEKNGWFSKFFNSRNLPMSVSNGYQEAVVHAFILLRTDMALPWIDEVHTSKDFQKVLRHIKDEASNRLTQTPLSERLESKFQNFSLNKSCDEYLNQSE